LLAIEKKNCKRTVHRLVKKSVISYYLCVFIYFFVEHNKKISS